MLDTECCGVPIGIACMRDTVALQAAHLQRQRSPDPVEVTVEKAGPNSRRVYAAIDIGAPVAAVWDALTDYEGLGNFIPGTLRTCFTFTSLIHALCKHKSWAASCLRNLSCVVM